jgi:tetratricopeptide (TPR) repeat protein
MRERNIAYISVLIAICLYTVGLSLETPGISNPVGAGTVPPTAYKSGLIPSANPIDTSGNLVITGNVAGGMNFRGVVPYSGVTNFSAPESSLSHTSGGIDSFLRNSAGSQNFAPSGGGLTPFYSPTQTVTATIPGTRGIVTTGGPMVALPAGGGLQSGQTGYQSAYNPQARNRPLSLSQQELEKLIETDITRYPLASEPVSLAQQQERFWQQLRVPMEQRPGPQGSEEVAGQPAPGAEPNVAMLLNFGAKLTRIPREGEEKESTATGQEETSQQFIPGAPGLEPEKKMDVYELMKIQAGKTTPGEEGLIESGEQKTRTGLKPDLWGTEANKPGESEFLPKAGQGGFSDVYKSFASYSNDRFNRHIKAAEGYMKEGKYYRAADAYTLATIYKPSDPLGYAGKSQALFAAGEYMSSALFLARALEIFPEYAKFKIDLVGIIGNKDTVETRILEAREWLDKSGSGELEFLLSYVYYQMDRLEFARRAIESAAKKMPDSPAAAALKKAIDERIVSQ